MTRTEEILAGLRGQNEPAEFEGQTGFWCQSDAVFVPAPDVQMAFAIYREHLAAASIGVSHNHACPSIRDAKRRLGLETAIPVLIMEPADDGNDAGS